MEKSFPVFLNHPNVGFTTSQLRVCFLSCLGGYFLSGL